MIDLCIVMICDGFQASGDAEIYDCREFKDSAAETSTFRDA